MMLITVVRKEEQKKMKKELKRRKQICLIKKTIYKNNDIWKLSVQPHVNMNRKSVLLYTEGFRNVSQESGYEIGKD